MKKSKVHIIEHPIIAHKLGRIRNKLTNPHEFREIFGELGSILAYECTRELKLVKEEVETPMQKTQVDKVGEDVIVACILRAGEGMLSSFMRALPFARFGHIGIYRDKFMNQTVEYYFKLPQDVKGRRMILLDPLLATGDTCLAALDRLKQYEVGPIQVVTILSCEVGIEKIHAEHPDVEIFTLSVEEGINEKGYLLPGLGDAGDRLFGTI